MAVIKEDDLDVLEVIRIKGKLYKTFCIGEVMANTDQIKFT